MIYQSQFIEMFVNRGLPIRHLPDISENLDSRRIPITSGSRIHGPYPYYGASGIVDYVEDFIFDEELLLISEDGANLKDRVSPIAFVAQGKYWVNNHAHILRFKCKEMQTYVEHLINYLNVEVYLTGMAQPKLNQEQLNSIPIPIPNEDRLDSFYLVVRHADKSKFAWFKSQFIEMFGKTKQSSIGSLFETTSGGTPSRSKSSYFDGGNIPWLTSSEVGQGIINKTESFITEDGLKNSSAKWVPANSVVVAMYGATVGKVGLLEIPCTTNQAVCSILPIDSIIPMFLLYAVKDKEEWMIDQAAGAAQPNISQAIIRKMEIPVPPKEEQVAFVEIAKQADKSKYLN